MPDKDIVASVILVLIFGPIALFWVGAVCYALYDVLRPRSQREIEDAEHVRQWYKYRLARGLPTSCKGAAIAYTSRTKEEIERMEQEVARHVAESQS